MLQQTIICLQIISKYIQNHQESLCTCVPDCTVQSCNVQYTWMVGVSNDVKSKGWTRNLHNNADFFSHFSRNFKLDFKIPGQSLTQDHVIWKKGQLTVFVSLDYVGFSPKLNSAKKQKITQQIFLCNVTQLDIRNFTLFSQNDSSFVRLETMNTYSRMNAFQDIQVILKILITFL